MTMARVTHEYIHDVSQTEISSFLREHPQPAVPFSASFLVGHDECTLKVHRLDNDTVTIRTIPEQQILGVGLARFPQFLQLALARAFDQAGVFPMGVGDEG